MDWSEQVVLVTGATGSFGRKFAELMLREYHPRKIIIFSRDELKQHDMRAAGFDHPSLRYFIGDVRDPQRLERAFAGVTVLVHAAALKQVPACEYNPFEAIQTNIMGGRNVIEAAINQGVRRILALSTDKAVNPVNLYGATKMGCEGLISAFQSLLGMRCWIFRFANIVGPKVRKRGRTVISDFIHRLQQDSGKLLILGNGKQAKSYLTAAECVDAMLFAIERAAGDLHVFNLGCDDSLTVDRIAELVIEAMGLPGVKLEYTGTEGGWPGDVPRFKLDVTRINRLGWKAKMTSEQAVNTAIEALVPLCRP